MTYRRSSGGNAHAGAVRTKNTGFLRGFYGVSLMLRNVREPYGEVVMAALTASPKTFGLMHDDTHPVRGDALRIVVVEDDCWIRIRGV